MGLDTPPAPDQERPSEAPDLAARLLTLGQESVRRGAFSAFALGLLGGAYLALGASLFIVASADNGLGFGASQLLGGIAFSFGLLLVLLSGAELCGANVPAVVAWLGGRVAAGELLAVSAATFLGNLLGALAVGLLALMAAQHRLGQSAVGMEALGIAAAKCEMPFGVALARGILGGALLCLGVWLYHQAATTGEKLLAIVLPFTALVACGFEYCVANMYLIPMGLALQGSEALGLVDPSLTLGRFVFANLVPVTIGNVLGGVVTIGAIYWAAHILPRSAPPRRSPRRRRRVSDRSAPAGDETRTLRPPQARRPHDTRK